MADLIVFDTTLSPAAGPDPITRAGKLFACGTYADKDFTLSEAEADAAIAAFRPVAADLEHMPTVLDGHLGELTRVWRDGADLFGAVAVPAWLDPLLDATGRKVSLAWDRATKQITGWGWVRTPRITDAALYAAFAGARHNASDQRAIDAAHDAIVHAGATCPAPPQEARMSLWDSLRAALEGAPAEDVTPPPPPVAAFATVLQPAAPDPRLAELETALAAERARTAEQAATFAAEQAATFTANLVTQGRLLPAQGPAFAALYARLLADDAASPAPVTFTDALGQPHADQSRAALLAAVVGTAPPHALFGERVAGGAALTALPAQPPTPAPYQAEYDAAAAYARQVNKEISHK